MDHGYGDIAVAAAKLADELPLETARVVAQIIEASPDLATAEVRMAGLPHPHYREQANQFVTIARHVGPSCSPQAVALSLLTAAQVEHAHRQAQSLELVWTGPDVTAIPSRRTEQAILQVLDSAQRRITLVSYAVYRIPHICDALVRAARRGVVIRIVIETPDRIEGVGEYSTLRALGEDVAASAAVFYWPAEQRIEGESGKLGILHVKCAVADGRVLFLSSANLTAQAFAINMELGLLITGGRLPSQVEEHFDSLIAGRSLHRL